VSGQKDDAVFIACRPRLMGVAYGMLATTGEAEDVVQDAYLRWRAAGREGVRDAEAYLVVITTRLALDRLGSARARRETYIGPWLPEPLVTACGIDADPAAAVEGAEQLSLALLMALERLDPVQRAVLLLRDVFDLDYAEVADAVDRSPTTCRQIARRARKAAGEPRRRFAVDADDERRLTREFMTAVGAGDVAGLAALLAADATLWSDGGGVVLAARKPILGADRVARFLVGISRRFDAAPETELVRVNGDPGWRVTAPERARSVIALELAPDGRTIANVRIVVNPHKLRHLAGAD
jgi:RNA polymerase sigma-70 factor (ECF subfamily)